MAEQVNQRIEDMINELEQMRRTNLFDDEEIREISRKRKEFEYRIQRRVKQKEDFVHYISYELALLEDINLRRKQAKLSEKKNDIEYAVAKRLNKVFKQFIYRFQNEVEVYFEYIKFCQSVGFHHAISGIIGQMLQIHGDKPKMWLLASKWEKEEEHNLENARSFLLKGLHRHPEADILYVELFQIELHLCAKENAEKKEKQIKRADIVWRNGLKNLNDLKFLFNVYDICIKFDADNSITESIKQEIWSRHSEKEVWPYIASKELQGNHWKEIEECVEISATGYPKQLQYFIAIYERALQQFPDEKLCTQYIHKLLGVNEAICTNLQKISAVKEAWYYGHDNGLLSTDIFAFGIEVLKMENEISDSKLKELLDNVSMNVYHDKYVWEEKLKLCKSDVKEMLAIVQDAVKVLKPDAALALWNFMLDNVESKDAVNKIYKSYRNCENVVLLALKPKLLQKMYECNGLKAAREMYEELIKVPPTQIDTHTVMIDIEKSQEKPNIKNIRKYYECLVQHHGKDSVIIWMNYMKFEAEQGNAQSVPNIYRRAIGALKKELVDEFIKAQTLAKLK
ncbi:unnamed protein product [Diatraea saccharalis]|uniref:U3 small nucleolar RNA-associated protein 6 homolog n=1 Tax=Diatraea saccharalis TaxID=40085 RepID=A0A9N9WJT7_9NEOP|nr:unnamed protein product [Diatraea saccharalis]